MNAQFFTIPTGNLVSRILSNKHTSAAAAAFGLAAMAPKLLVGLAHIWCPAHEQQVSETCDLIASCVKNGAVIYGLIMAGDSDSKPKPPSPDPSP